MTVFNKRNAAVGWLSWMVSKRVLKRKAKRTRRLPNASAVALLLASAVGLAFWRMHTSS
jgi:hypothetical protein